VKEEHFHVEKGMRVAGAGRVRVGLHG
jgi:hypothetical protein